VAKKPLVRDNVGVPKRRHEFPTVIAEESAVLCGHSIEPVRILESRTCGCRNRRVLVDRSMQVMPLTRRDMYVGGATCVMCRRGC
jgi:hypothetical protein